MATPLTTVYTAPSTCSEGIFEYDRGHSDFIYGEGLNSFCVPPGYLDAEPSLAFEPGICPYEFTEACVLVLTRKHEQHVAQKYTCNTIWTDGWEKKYRCVTTTTTGALVFTSPDFTISSIAIDEPLLIHALGVYINNPGQPTPKDRSLPVVLVTSDLRNPPSSGPSATALPTSAPSSTGPGTTSSGASTDSGSASNSIPPSPSSDHGLSSGAKAGIAIGAVLGGLLLFAGGGLAALILYRRNRRRQQQPQDHQEHQEHQEHQNQTMSPPNLGSHHAFTPSQPHVPLSNPATPAVELTAESPQPTAGEYKDGCSLPKTALVEAPADFAWPLHKDATPPQGPIETPVQSGADATAGTVGLSAPGRSGEK